MGDVGRRNTGSRSLLLLTVLLALLGSLLWTLAQRSSSDGEVSALPHPTSTTGLRGDPPRRDGSLSSTGSETEDPSASQSTQEDQPQDEAAALGAPASSTADIPTALITGYVYDVRTREAVPDVEITFSGAGLSTRAITRGNGSFSSESGLPFGRQTAVVRDHGTRIHTAERERSATDAGGWVLRIPIGPTYPLALPHAEQDLSAPQQVRVVESLYVPDSAGEIEVTEGRLLLAGADEEGIPIVREWPWTPVRSTP